MSKELAPKNKYGFEEQDPVVQQTAALVQAQSSKAVQEIQAALTIARHNPRDENKSYQRIINACKRPFLAEQAIYAYPRAGTSVTGPSIRLAEVLAQNWGNISTGIREISQSNGVSEVEAFAWDLETNFQATKIFHVKHERYTKKGITKLTDPRDIYELVANNGARRQRACILAIIPGDIVEAAVEECQKTMASDAEPIADRVRKLVSAFDDIGISVESIEKRLGHNLAAIIEPEIVRLRAIYKSLKDGMAKREDFFEIGSHAALNDNKDIDNHLASLVANKNKEMVNTETGEVLPCAEVVEFFDKEK